MAGEGPPSTPFVRTARKRRGWRAFARHDGVRLDSLSRRYFNAYGAKPPGGFQGGALTLLSVPRLAPPLALARPWSAGLYAPPWLPGPSLIRIAVNVALDGVPCRRVRAAGPLDRRRPPPTRSPRSGPSPPAPPRCCWPGCRCACRCSTGASSGCPTCSASPVPRCCGAALFAAPAGARRRRLAQPRLPGGARADPACAARHPARAVPPAPARAARAAGSRHATPPCCWSARSRTLDLFLRALAQDRRQSFRVAGLLAIGSGQTGRRIQGQPILGGIDDIAGGARPPRRRGRGCPPPSSSPRPTWPGAALSRPGRPGRPLRPVAAPRPAPHRARPRRHRRGGWSCARWRSTTCSTAPQVPLDREGMARLIQGRRVHRHRRRRHDRQRAGPPGRRVRAGDADPARQRRIRAVADRHRAGRDATRRCRARR